MVVEAGLRRRADRRKIFLPDELFVGARCYVPWFLASHVFGYNALQYGVQGHEAMPETGLSFGTTSCPYSLVYWKILKEWKWNQTVMKDDTGVVFLPMATQAFVPR